MNYYEVLYILNPNFSKEQIAGVMSEVNDFVEKKKHGIVNHDFWGKKQLAYNVKKHKYGNFILPRASLLYSPSEKTSLRIGGGVGYKEPNPFGEEAEAIQYRGISPFETSKLVAEESFGLNVDLSHSFDLATGATLNLNLLFFYKR